MVDELEAPPAGPCLSCRIQFRAVKTDSLGYELSSIPSTGKGTITIEDSVNYQFFLPDQVLPLDAGTWNWDLETFETDDMTGPANTWVRGTIVVTKDISHD